MSHDAKPSPLTYKDAGVDVEKAAALVKDIAELRKSTESKRKLFQSFGLFAASFDLSGYDAPVILTACDGVGTKIKPLLAHDMIEIAGVDLVAMNVNDIMTSNANPILFLDYIGIARIDKPLISRLIKGITEGLNQCDCILAGGETAEMPDLVEEGVVELSGFCVGAAEKHDLIDISGVAPGDVIIGSPSNGFHANGWSLVRKLLDQYAADFSEEEVRGLLAPTRIYYQELTALREASIPVKAMAHITGGGIRENLPRVLCGNGANLKLPRWEDEPVQKILSHLKQEECFRTFNMGFGWMTLVAAGDVDRTLEALPDATVLGEVGGDAVRIEVAS